MIIAEDSAPSLLNQNPTGIPKEMSKTKGIKYDYDLTVDISRICEYVYRKGVCDGASLGSPDAVLEVAIRDDGHKTFAFLFNEFGKNVNLDHYCDILGVFSRTAKTGALAETLRGGVLSKMVRNTVPYLCEYYYRTGLKDGTEIDVDDAESFFEDVSTGKKHDRLGKSENLSEAQFLDQIRVDIRFLGSYIREDMFGRDYFSEMVAFMSEAIKCKEAEKEIKNDTKR